jgi:hypothetical protein
MKKGVKEENDDWLVSWSCLAYWSMPLSRLPDAGE